jgi:hypothetical protein
MNKRTLLIYKRFNGLANSWLIDIDKGDDNRIQDQICYGARRMKML